MSRGEIDRFSGQVPLPEGWDVEKDVDGKPFYIDHNTKQTTWVDPRDRLTKPASFADCLGDELPYGWEQAYDPKIGTYFINHLTKMNQIEDPRLKWREEQEKMLREYLADANQDLMAKKQIFFVKNERLTLANEEVQSLTDKLAHWKASGTSLNSTSSYNSTKYDPDLLRADISHARSRVSRLKQELEHVRASMQYTEKGLEMLKQVNDKMVENQNIYNIEEAQAVLRHISELNKSLVTGEKEKLDLLMSVAKLKDDILRTGLRTGSSPDVSTLLLPQERANTASQTDLSGEASNHFGELVRLRLQHNEAKGRMRQLQMELANIESQLIPGQIESDRDRLVLIEEKEQLLRELRSLNLRGRSAEEVNSIQMRVCELEEDLRQEIEKASQQMAVKNVRLELNQAECDVLQNLAETAKLITQLEIKIRTLSSSAASLSSGSSLGSLGSLSASSRGSQNSMALSFTDIYSMQSQMTTEVNLPELHRRVERLLQGHRNFVSIPEDVVSSSDIPFEYTGDSMGLLHQAELQPLRMMAQHKGFTSEFETCSLPSYEEHMERQRSQNLAVSQELISRSYPNMAVNDVLSSSVNQSLTDLKMGSSLSQTADLGRLMCSLDYQTSCQCLPYTPFDDCLADKTDKLSNPPLSPISESSSGVCNVLYYSSNTQSVSAAMSDDSITGGSDSGVSESNMIYRSKDAEGIVPVNLESAQVQIKIEYAKLKSTLEIKIEQAKNLCALCIPENFCKMFFQVSLLPSGANSQPQLTQLKDFCSDMVFDELFPFAVNESKVSSKTVQINFCCRDGDHEEMCCGVVLISLASFDLSAELVNWYNILNLNIMHVDHEHVSPSLPSITLTPLHLQHQVVDGVEETIEEDAAAAGKGTKLLPKSKRRSSSAYYKESAQLSSSSAVLPTKEESSDESTVISSQTSTLTRNREAEELEGLKGKDDDELKQYCGLMSSVGDDENESADECEDDEIREAEDQQKVMYESIWPGELNVVNSLSTCQRKFCDNNYTASASAFDGSVLAVKCDKETNTDQSSNQKSGSQLSRQSHDMNRGSTIRRWQTFSPTAAGITDEDLGCRLSRSGSDSSVRNRRSHFERHAHERQSIRLKKSSSSVSKSSTPCNKTTNRTSIDLELDLQAHRVRLSHLNEEIFSLKELKRRLEESKEKGENEPNWLIENEQLQQFLNQTDKIVPLHDRRHNMSNIDELTQRKMRKAKKEIQKLQAASQHAQPNELSFRKKMAFFTTMTTSCVPFVNSDTPVAFELADSTSASRFHSGDESTMNLVGKNYLQTIVPCEDVYPQVTAVTKFVSPIEEWENTSNSQEENESCILKG